MTKKKQKFKPVKLPPPEPYKDVRLTQGEQQLLVGLLTSLQEALVEQMRSGKGEPDTLAKINFAVALSDKIMNEEEAARYLQSLGFEVVEKEKNDE